MTRTRMINDYLNHGRVTPDVICRCSSRRDSPTLEQRPTSEAGPGSCPEALLWEVTCHERTSGNENQPEPATEIHYLKRQSPLCGVVLRDHSREHLIRCQASFRMRRQSSASATGTQFHLMGPQFHLMGSSFSFNRTSFAFKPTSFALKWTPFSFQTFTHILPANLEGWFSTSTRLYCRRSYSGSRFRSAPSANRRCCRRAHLPSG